MKIFKINSIFAKPINTVMIKSYSAFETYIFRTPLFRFQDAYNRVLFPNHVFEEALRLASPEFFQEQQKENANTKKNTKIDVSLFKYLSRAATRCTPFGLFAGCSVGSLGEDTTITLNGVEKHCRVTRLDMNYLCALIQNLERRPEIRNQLLYYPNDSIYKLGGKYRYVEYFYQGLRRIHKISSVDISEYLTSLLSRAENGQSCTELATLLVDDDISLEEAKEFIEELMEAQLLKSELEIAVTGENPLSVLIGKLQKLQGTATITQTLDDIRSLLKQIDDTPIGLSTGTYDKIVELIKKLGVNFEPKFLFQTDMFKPVKEGTVSRQIIDEIASAVTFLNKITLKPTQTNLSAFAGAFAERYEEQEIPLLEVLDTELGMGYLKASSVDVPNELLAGVVYQIFNTGSSSVEFNRIQAILLKKYMECMATNTDTITLTDSDIPVKNAEWKDTPVTLPVMCSLLNTDPENISIYVKSVGGSGAANLLGRFCHIDKSIEQLCKNIAAKEQAFAGEAVLAEIVHLPEARTGNILFRPILRDYEIHYLAKPGVAGEFQIPLSDLYVSVRGGKVFLRSHKLNKQIIPRLTTAHNYSYNAQPVYQFLCDLQFQDLRAGFFLGFGSIFDNFDFRPRVVYGKCILSRK